MAHTVTLAHDPSCPWCWIGFFQAQRLHQEFGVKIDWVGYELWPAELPRPAASPAAPVVESNRPATPSRLDLAYAAQGMEAPTAERPKGLVFHNTLQIFELAKRHQVEWPVLEAVYRAFWEQGKDISQPEVLVGLTAGHLDPIELHAVLEEKRFASDIVPFDDEAYARGIYNVPTFIIDGQRYAEQPYAVLARAVKAWVG